MEVLIALFSGLGLFLLLSILGTWKRWTPVLTIQAMFAILGGGLLLSGRYMMDYFSQETPVVDDYYEFVNYYTNPCEPGFIENLPLLLAWFSAGFIGTVLGLSIRWRSFRPYVHPAALRGKNSFEIAFAARITFRNKRNISNLVVRLGIISIMLGVAVMEVAVSIVYGFQREIQHKVNGFGSHVQIGHLLAELDSEVDPLPLVNDFIPAVRQQEGVISVAPYVVKPCMLRSKTTQEGIVLKGVDSTYHWQFFEDNLVTGRIPDFHTPKASREVLISKKLSELLNVDTGAKVIAYFFDEKPRPRNLNVVGIYETGLEEFDQVRVMCDQRVLQRIWRWEENQVAGFEILLDDPEDMDCAAYQIQELLPPELAANTSRDLFPELFEWVELQHQNVWFILGLMIVIAIINMTSVILILILERTQTIGVLKALGLSGFRIQSLFVTNAFYLILIGIGLGNLLGLGLILSQDLWGWLTVDQESYFVDVVPVRWMWDWILIINLGVTAICTIFMYFPAMLIGRISAVRALRFQ